MNAGSSSFFVLNNNSYNICDGDYEQFIILIPFSVCGCCAVKLLFCDKRLIIVWHTSVMIIVCMPDQPTCEPGQE